MAASVEDAAEKDGNLTKKKKSSRKNDTADSCFHI